MIWLVYIIVGLAASWLIYLVYLQITSRNVAGQSLDKLIEVIPELGGERSGVDLVYCYSERCGPCRAMTPQVEALQKESSHVFKLDVYEHIDVAKSLKVCVTPSLLVIQDGVIRKCLFGTKSKKAMAALLK